MLKLKKIHFVGVGGIGVSALAEILLNKGISVSGSDNVPSDITRNLAKAGAKVYNKHSASNLDKDTELVVYSPAIMQDNPELAKARNLKIRCLSYPQALGLLSERYYTIAVAGSHGKSTTTAMIARIMYKAGLDPTVVVGTKMPEFGNMNFRVGDSKYLVIEACEYKDSFLNFTPNILVITNIEADHLDYFKNVANYKKSFAKIANKVPKDGFILINLDDKYAKTVVKNAKAKVITFSSSKKYADYFLYKNLLIEKPISKKLDKKSEQHLNIEPGVIGNFNLVNGSMASMACRLLKIENKKIEQALKGFRGSWRRLETKKTSLKGPVIIDDYGHHPTEIKKTLAAIRIQYPKDKILCVFQPHQYNRTFQLLKDFGTSFGSVDQVIIPNIYQVRDSKEDVKSVSTDKLVKEIRKHRGNVTNGGGLEKTAEYLRLNYKKFGVIVTMGAGDIENIYGML